MKNFLNRVFKFLEVEDKKQSGINRLFFILIVTWVGIGLVVNISSQFVYYFITLPEYKSAVFFQTETNLIRDLAKEGGGWLVAAITIVGLVALWRQGNKERKEMYETLRSLEKPLDEIVILVKSLSQKR